MLKIDIHTYILPESWPDLKERFREVGADCWDPDALEWLALRREDFE